MPSHFCTVGAAALLTTTAIGVAAQAADAPLAAASAVAAASAPAPYRSAFVDYRPFKEQPLALWRQVNDQVGQIGGWQAYAREGQGGPVAGSALAPERAASVPAIPGMAGHAMPGDAKPGTPAASVRTAPGASAAESGAAARGPGRKTP